MYTAEDLRRDYPGSNPKAGICPPIEAVWRMNTMTYEEFQDQLAQERESRRRSANLAESERIATEVEAMMRELELSGLPHRYMGAASDSRRNEQFASGRGLWVHGPVGTGKTLFVCSALKGWIGSGRVGRFVSSVGLLTELRTAMDLHRELDTVQRYSSIPLLVVDDLGQEVPTDWALSRIFEIIDGRYNNKLPTVVTSNCTPPELVKRLEGRGGTEAADAIVSRLIETSELLYMPGEDRRLS